MKHVLVPILSLLCACPGNPPPAAPTTGSAAPPPAAPAGTHDITKPCSMITADEVGGILGFPVTATDEQFRCRFTDGKGGYLTLALMESTLRSAQEICGYAPDKRTAVPGVGDSASYLGATACVKLGDVAIIVDGPNLADSSEAMRASGPRKPEILIGKLVASRIH